MTEQEMIAGLALAVIVYASHLATTRRHQPQPLYIQMEPQAADAGGIGCLGLVVAALAVALVFLLFGGN